MKKLIKFEDMRVDSLIVEVRAQKVILDADLRSFIACGPRF